MSGKGFVGQARKGLEINGWVCKSCKKERGELEGRKLCEKREEKKRRGKGGRKKRASTFEEDEGNGDRERTKRNEKTSNARCGSRGKAAI